MSFLVRIGHLQIGDLAHLGTFLLTISSVKMPAAVSSQPSLDSLTSHFPLTFPIPTPATHPDLISTKDLYREEDLLRNPFSFRHWWDSIQNTKDAASYANKLEGPSDVPPEVAALLGPLSSPSARKTLQRLTYLYESALVQFPTSFKLWKSYLQTRMSFVLGKLKMKKKAGGKKKFPEMREALEDEKEDLEEREGGLDGVVGWEEWKSLVATFERALMWLSRVCVSHYAIVSLVLTECYRCLVCGCSTSPYSTTHSARP